MQIIYPRRAVQAGEVTLRHVGAVLDIKIGGERVGVFTSTGVEIGDGVKGVHPQQEAVGVTRAGKEHVLFQFEVQFVLCFDASGTQTHEIRRMVLFEQVQVSVGDVAY